METRSVSSSNLRRVGFDEPCMYVEFKNGEVYCYQDVSYSTFDALTKAESAGKFFQQNVRGQYQYSRIAAHLWH